MQLVYKPTNKRGQENAIGAIAKNKNKIVEYHIREDQTQPETGGSIP